MNSLSQNDKGRYEKYQAASEEEFIAYISRKLLALYPGLLFRWSKIYGNRWAYLCGNSSEVALNPLKIALNHDYGICIDNPDILNNCELDKFAINLRESLDNDTAF